MLKIATNKWTTASDNGKYSMAREQLIEGVCIEDDATIESGYRFMYYVVQNFMRENETMGNRTPDIETAQKFLVRSDALKHIEKMQKFDREVAEVLDETVYEIEITQNPTEVIDLTTNEPATVTAKVGKNVYSGTIEGGKFHYRTASGRKSETVNFEFLQNA
jgi:hypothetical protein